MGAKLSFHYDREADTLLIFTREPYAEQESEELPDEIVARLNPETGDVEGLEVLFYSARLMREHEFVLPIQALFKLTDRAS